MESTLSKFSVRIFTKSRREYSAIMYSETQDMLQRGLIERIQDYEWITGFDGSNIRTSEMEAFDVLLLEEGTPKPEEPQLEKEEGGR